MPWRASCNLHSARHTVDGDRLTLGPATFTEMACAPDLMVQESAFLGFLEAATRLHLEDGRLVLGDDQGRQVTARRP